MRFITITNPEEIRTQANKRRVRSQAMRFVREINKSRAGRPALPRGVVHIASIKAAAYPSGAVGPPHLCSRVVPQTTSVPSFDGADRFVDFPVSYLDYSRRGTSNNAEQIPESDTNQETSSHETPYRYSYVHEECDLQAPVCETAISFWEVANLDPFQTSPAAIGKVEQGLMHHWINVFGTMMFGKPRSSIDPMAEVWIPDALSNEASFQGMLSYAAAHLAYLHGQRSSAQGTMYRVKAIKFIQKRINNSETAFGDITVAAILRQISIEDRFESVEVARLHRAGLDKIIEERGGLSGFRGNWSLELLLHWYLLTSKPTFYPRRLTDREVSVDSTYSTVRQETMRFRHLRQLPGSLSIFFAFFSTLRNLAEQEISDCGNQLFSIGLGRGPANRLLYLFNNVSGPSRGPTHDIIEETCRMASLFYMAAVKADSLRLGGDALKLLNNTLSETWMAWEYSSEMLLWILLRGKGPGLENPKIVHLVLSLMDVSKLLQKESWNIVKEGLIGFICGDPQKAVDIDEASMLFMSDKIGMQS